MRKLDLDDKVVHWSSEEMSIPYRSPVDGRTHRYFPDFLIEQKQPNGGTRKFLIEIKPAKETVEPKRQGKSRKRLITEHKTYAVNQAKWAAAEAWCHRMGITFQILTEVELGIK